MERPNPKHYLPKAFIDGSYEDDLIAYIDYLEAENLQLKKAMHSEFATLENVLNSNGAEIAKSNQMIQQLTYQPKEPLDIMTVSLILFIFLVIAAILTA